MTLPSDGTAPADDTLPPDDAEQRRQEKHRRAMVKQQANVAASLAQAKTQRGVAVLLTGNGKGKSSSAFGMVMRALGHGQKVGVVQFIKGQQLSGEEIYVRDRCPEVAFCQMGTGFTWDTQDRAGDMAAAARTWQFALTLLQDPTLDLVVLDELTYMIAYDYLPEAEILAAITGRPPHQSLVVTGRGGGSALQAVMDTVSEVKDIKHAYNAGIQARAGVDY